MRIERNHRKTNRKGKSGQTLNGIGPPFLDHTLEKIQNKPIASRNMSHVSYSFCYKAFKGEQVLELFSELSSLDKPYAGFFPK